jgi:hypothetical protein
LQPISTRWIPSPPLDRLLSPAMVIFVTQAIPRRKLYGACRKPFWRPGPVYS